MLLIDNEVNSLNFDKFYNRTLLVGKALVFCIKTFNLQPKIQVDALNAAIYFATPDKKLNMLNYTVRFSLKKRMKYFWCFWTCFTSNTDYSIILNESFKANSYY
jgi:hypothetical protein